MKRIVGLEAAIEYFGESRSRSRPDQLSDGNGFFEELLAPGEFASRVVVEVRAHGDLAVKRISEHIDGSPLAFIEVPADTVEAAPSMISGGGQGRAAIRAGEDPRVSGSGRASGVV